MQVQYSNNNLASVQFSGNKKNRTPNYLQLNDSQLKEVAKELNNTPENEKKNQRNLLMAFMSIPILSTIASGIFAKVPVAAKPEPIVDLVKPILSTKLKAVAVTAAIWTGSLAFLGLFNKGEKALLSHSETMQTFSEKHPIAMFFGNVGLIVGGCALGVRGFLKLATKEHSLNPKIGDKIEELSKKLDSSKVNTEWLPKFSDNMKKLSTKIPFLAKTGKAIMSHPLLSGFAIYVGTAISNSHNEVERTRKTYHQLKNEQVKQAKQAISVLQIERDVLAQDQPELAEALNQTLNRTLHSKSDNKSL